MPKNKKFKYRTVKVYEDKNGDEFILEYGEGIWAVRFLDEDFCDEFILKKDALESYDTKTKRRKR